jgi:hypothetical protein
MRKKNYCFRPYCIYYTHALTPALPPTMFNARDTYEIVRGNVFRIRPPSEDLATPDTRVHRNPAAAAGETLWSVHMFAHNLLTKMSQLARQHESDAPVIYASLAQCTGMFPAREYDARPMSLRMTTSLVTAADADDATPQKTPSCGDTCELRYAHAPLVSRAPTARYASHTAELEHLHTNSQVDFDLLRERVLDAHYVSNLYFACLLETLAPYFRARGTAAVVAFCVFLQHDTPASSSSTQNATGVTLTICCVYARDALNHLGAMVRQFDARFGVAASCASEKMEDVSGSSSSSSSSSPSSSSATEAIAKSRRAREVVDERIDTMFAHEHWLQWHMWHGQFAPYTLECCAYRRTAFMRANEAVARVLGHRVQHIAGEDDGDDDDDDDDGGDGGDGGDERHRRVAHVTAMWWFEAFVRRCHENRVDDTAVGDEVRLFRALLTVDRPPTPTSVADVMSRGATHELLCGIVRSFEIDGLTDANVVARAPHACRLQWHARLYDTWTWTWSQFGAYRIGDEYAYARVAQWAVVLHAFLRDFVRAGVIPLGPWSLALWIDERSGGLSLACARNKHEHAQAHVARASALYQRAAPAPSSSLDLADYMAQIRLHAPSSSSSSSSSTSASSASAMRDVAEVEVEEKESGASTAAAAAAAAADEAIVYLTMSMMESALAREFSAFHCAHMASMDQITRQCASDTLTRREVRIHVRNVHPALMIDEESCLFSDAHVRQCIERTRATIVDASATRGVAEREYMAWIFTRDTHLDELTRTNVQRLYLTCLVMSRVS